MLNKELVGSDIHHIFISRKFVYFCFQIMIALTMMSVLFSKCHRHTPSAPIRSRTYDLPITSSDALVLSYRRLVEAEAIKLGS